MTSTLTYVTLEWTTNLSTYEWDWHRTVVW